MTTRVPLERIQQRIGTRLDRATEAFIEMVRSHAAIARDGAGLDEAIADIASRARTHVVETTFAIGWDAAQDGPGEPDVAPPGGGLRADLLEAETAAVTQAAIGYLRSLASRDASVAGLCRVLMNVGERRISDGLREALGGEWMEPAEEAGEAAPMTRRGRPLMAWVATHGDRWGRTALGMGLGLLLAAWVRPTAATLVGTGLLLVATAVATIPLTLAAELLGDRT